MGAAKASDNRGGKRESTPLARDLWRIEPLPEDLIGSPLDLIFAEHIRHREAAQIMALIADREEETRADKRAIYAMLHDFLRTDFVQHAIDEEAAFFPLLMARCQPQDGIERLIARLVEEHAADRASESEIVSALSRAAEGGELDSATRRKLRVLSERLRQHIALENAVLLPIARARVAPKDFDALSERLRTLRSR